MSNSERLYEASQVLIPGGVNSPVRAFKGVGGNPIFFKQGKGAYLIDVDNRHYIDYVSSWGALILGHCHPEIVQTIYEIAKTGISFGAPTQLEVQLAEKIISLMPSIEKIRMVNSGTEATMTALRLARGFTGRDKVIKFNGCYHGHSDSLLAKAGSGLFTLGIPSSPGVPASVAAHTLTADYNHLDQVEILFERYPEQIAGVIVEPVAGNMGFVQPQADFLKGLRDLCNDKGAVLIFDEVMTGFRVGLGGAQALFHVKPDLTTLGKVIGGGLPIGAVGGKTEIMDCLAPLGCIYQAGTLSGNPLAMGAGLETLNQLEKPGFYDKLSNVANYLIEGLTGIARSFEIPFYASALGGMFGFSFTKKSQIIDHQDVTSSDERLFKRFFHGMLQKGVYFAPSMYEAGFVSSAHCQDEVDLTLEAAKSVFDKLVSKVKD